MGVDTNVLLRVRDRAALREALERYAAKDRQSWTDQGRDADYDQLVADGYDPKPLMWPQADGSVAMFTGLRFHDQDMEYSIRGWLHAYFGDALSRIHDDPRGVFVSPDVCEPRAKTYDGIIAELGDAGRFIDPSPPTKEEQVARAQQLELALAGLLARQAAEAAGDEPIRAPELRAAREVPELDLTDGVAIMGKMLGIALNDADGDPISETPEGMGEMFAKLMAQSLAKANADPMGHGRVAMLLPAVVAKALAANPPATLDVQHRTDLADGSTILVTSWMGEAVMDSTKVAAALEEMGIDRAGLGPLPFFKESLVEEVASKPTFADAKEALGERVELLPLQTWDEVLEDQKEATTAWLEANDEP